MKITIDTTEKIIKIDDTVNFGEFIKEIEKLFPNGEWKEYKLESIAYMYQPHPYIYPEPYYYQIGFDPAIVNGDTTVFTNQNA